MRQLLNNGLLSKTNHANLAAKFLNNKALLDSANWRPALLGLIDDIGKHPWTLGLPEQLLCLGKAPATNVILADARNVDMELVHERHHVLTVGVG